MHVSPSSSSSRVYTVPAYADFIASLAAGLIQEAQGDPLRLSDRFVLVPDRVTARALRAALVSQLGGGMKALPRIEALDALDATSASLLTAAHPPTARKLLSLPATVSREERQMVLAGEVMKVPGLSPSLAGAMRLAEELGLLIDAAAIHDVDLKQADSFLPQTHQAQWEKTRHALRIITETWPSYLAQKGLMDQAAKKRQVLMALADHWRRFPPAGPILAAGFRAADPAVRAVLKSVSAALQGVLVLQGFAADMDDDAWARLTPAHPDASFKTLLADVGVARDQVASWPAALPRTVQARAVNVAQTNAARQKLLQKAMLPADAATDWTDLRIDPQSLNGMDLLTAGSPQEEASVIALKMRETLEVSGRTAALVTADRTLARRVAARLRMWGIAVNDGAGQTLADTNLGIYLYATAHMAAEEWAPVPFLQALKHPLALLGRDPETFQSQLAVLEDMALHGPRPAPGARGLRASLKAAFNEAARRRTAPAEELKQQHDQSRHLVRDLVRAGDVFFKLMARKRPQPFTDLLDAHLRYIEALATGPGESGATRLWRGAAGVQAARLFTRLRQNAHLLPPMTGRDYAAVMDRMMRDLRVAPSAGDGSPFLSILTPAQALQARADVLIVGGLTAGVWPPTARETPWLTTSMREGLGLPAPSEKTGDYAHAFVQALSAPNVLLTRAVRSGDAPTVASPLLTRLLMVVRAAGLEKNLTGKSQLLDIHAAIHAPAEVNPVLPPEPRPEAALRPRKLPVTAIEKLMRDPYSVYARYILRLRPKAPIDAAPGVADRGIATHAALDAFLRKYPDALPDNPYETLLAIGRETFAAHLENPTVQSFWWPRFERVAQWFVRFEEERRDMSRTLGTEVHGRLDIDLGDSVFTLTSIADRIDRTQADTLDIIDYKTGAVPSQKSVSAGVSPQLTLEALIAFTGGFKGIDAAEVGSLQYWKLSGGRPAGDVTVVKGDIRTLVEVARTGVTDLMKAFARKDTPYLVTPRPDLAPRYNDYTHLSRVGEWSTVMKSGPGPAKPKVNRKTTKTAANRNRRKAPVKKAAAPGGRVKR